MAEQLWVIRAGSGARFAGDFLSGGIVGVDFSDLASDDLAAVGEDALKARGTSPRGTSQREHVLAGQLSAFAFRVEVGDLVIVPRLPKIDYLVGRVKGPYLYVVDAPALGHHQRSVEWLGTLPWSELSPSAVSTLGARQTMFREVVPGLVEFEWRSPA